MARRKLNLASTLPDILSDAETLHLVTLFMRTVGARIRELRNMQGLTLAHVRDEHGFNVSQLSRIENGKQNLTIWTAVRLAYVLGVRPWDFYVPREKAEALKPKRRRRPRLGKAALEQDSAAFRKHVGERIRALRQLQGMSLAALEDLSGVSVHTLTPIERGKANIRASTAIRIADAIGVQPHELYIPAEQSGIRPRGGREQDA